MSRVWSGQASLEKRLKAITSPRAQKMLGAVLFDIGDDVAADASHSITSGSAGGHSGGKHQHVVSAPGQPPNEEYGDLREGIEVLQPETLEVVVQANAAHSVPLEFGTSRMAARPFFRPARDRNRRPGRKKFANAVDRIVKGAAD
jgi:HK97 gp10 family phage protein